MNRVPMRSVAVVLLALALVAGACVEERNAPQGESGGESTEPIRLGLVAPFSGTAASIGRNMREGMSIAIDELNAGGGVLGRQIELLEMDNEFDPAKTSEVTRELIQRQGVVALFGPPGTTSYLAIDDLVRQEEVPTFPVVTGPQLKEEVNPYTFRLMIPDDIQIGLLAEYAAERFERVAILAEDNETGRSIAEIADEELSSRGKSPVSVEFFSEDELDLSPIVLEASQADADAVIIGSHIGPYAARIATAADSLGYDAQLLGLAGLTSYTYADLARDGAVGTVFVAPPIPVLAGTDTPAAQAFHEAYVGRYFPDGTKSDSGADKVTGAAYLTYDGVMMWARAAEDAGSADPAAVVEVFNAGFDFGPEESSAGIAWHYDANDHEGFHEGDTWFYQWDETPAGIEFTFLGDAAEILAG
ncbi:MAG TPA: ABC transporter substrate-binding protein [Actinomycetota bacterium]